MRGCRANQAPGDRASLKTPLGPQSVSQDYSLTAHWCSVNIHDSLCPGVRAWGLALLGLEQQRPGAQEVGGSPCRALPASGSPIQPPVGSMQGGGPGRRSPHGAGTQPWTPNFLWGLAI